MVVSKINQNYAIQTAQYVKDELGLNSFMATKAGKPINATQEYDKYAMGLIDFRKLIDDLVYIKRELGMTVDSLTAYPHCAYSTEESFQLIGAKRNCSAGKTAAAIGYDGSVKACPREQQTYGNLKKDTLIACWDKMSDWRDYTFLPENCKECNRKEQCAGGCRVESFAIKSLMNADDPCSDLSNLPVKFQYSNLKIAEFNDTDVFVLNSNFEVMNEEFGFRITINSQSRFITDELYNFIHSYLGKKFSKADLENYFDIEESLANELICFLKGVGLAVLI